MKLQELELMWQIELHYIVRDASGLACIFLLPVARRTANCGLLPKIVTQNQRSFIGAKFLGLIQNRLIIHLFSITNVSISKTELP